MRYHMHPVHYFAHIYSAIKDSALTRAASGPYTGCPKKDYRLKPRILMHALRIDLRILGLIRELKHANLNMQH